MNIKADDRVSVRFWGMWPALCMIFSLVTGVVDGEGSSSSGSFEEVVWYLAADSLDTPEAMQPEATELGITEPESTEAGTSESGTTEAEAPELVYDTGGALTPEQEAFDVTYYGLDLRIDPEKKTIAGSVDIYGQIMASTNAIELALDPAMTIHSVQNQTTGAECLVHRSGAASKRFTIEANCIREEREAHPGDEFALQIHYGGAPREAPYPPWDGGIVWDSTKTGKPWVGAATQTNGAWIWWPNKDHNSDRPDSARIRLTVPEDLVAVSNGVLQSAEITEEGWKTWDWFTTYPVSTYNITINVAPYESIEESYTSITGQSIPVTFWVLPEDKDSGAEVLPQFLDHLRFFEQLLGPYPFPSEKYGIVHTPYLGMEHQSVIAYGGGFQDNNMFATEVGYDDLHHHELAHEWWGNMVYAADWKDFWIHEGFGTYMQALYSEHLYGANAYRDLMSYLRSRILSQAPMVPTVPVTMAELDGTGRGGDVYYKGAWVLHTLRFVVGDEAFIQILREFLYPNSPYGRRAIAELPASEVAENAGNDAENAEDLAAMDDSESTSGKEGSRLPLHQTSLPPLLDGSKHIRAVDSEEFQATAEEVFGQDLDWFFDVYLYRSELPVLIVSRMAGLLTIAWDIPDNRSFPMPLEVSFDGEVIVIVPENNRITLEVDDAVEVILDPNRRILNEFQVRQL